MSRVIVHSMNTSIPSATARSWSVRIISRPVRSPTWARRGWEWPPNGRCRIRPSRVRSNTAPQASSSRTRSGDSSAWSWAIRGLLRSLPPTIVSRKCVCQVSRSSTCWSEAATPPSAMTVWALPSNDLQTRPTFAPASAASMAARSPAPPAPTTRTSWGWRSTRSGRSKRSIIAGRSEPDRRVRDDPEREHPDVDVGERDRQQARPGPEHVVPVEAREALPARVPDLRPAAAREAVHLSADDVAERMARQGIAAQQRRVEEQDEHPQPDPDAAARREDRSHGIDPEEEQRDEREIQEVAVEVLEDEREGRLEAVLLVDGRLPHRAAGRVGEVEAVVGLPVVVAGRPEAERNPQDQQTRADPAGQPGRRDQRREQWGEVAVVFVRRLEERPEQDAADEEVRRADREDDRLDARGEPPRVLARRPTQAQRRGSRRLQRRAKRRADRASDHGHGGWATSSRCRALGMVRDRPGASILAVEGGGDANVARRGRARGASPLMPGRWRQGPRRSGPRPAAR